MKKTGVILLALALLACLFPQTVKAAETEDFDTALTAYLGTLSEERGREVTKDDLEYVLTLYSESLTDFDSIEGLKDFLGEAVKYDYSNLTPLYEKYGLDQDSLTKLLADYGESLDDYIFVNELDDTLYFYQGGDETVQETGFEEKLAAYLNEISALRGFTVSREMISTNLSKYETDLSAFETVEDLKDYLGEVIQADLGNLDYFYDEYALTPEDINAFLSENNKTLNDYIFMDDLEYDLLYSETGTITYDYIMRYLESEFPGITDKLGLTEDEFTAASNYFNSLKDYYSSEDTQNKMLDLLYRLQTLLENLPESDKDVTVDQLMEFQNLYQEMQDILKIKLSYSFIQDGKKVPLTLADLMGNKNLENAVLNIAVYTENSEFLMDINISADMFGDVIGNLEDLDNIPGQPSDTSAGGNNNQPVKTVNGGKLPKTASNYAVFILLGGVSLLAGTAFYKKGKNDKNETKAA